MKAGAAEIAQTSSASSLSKLSLRQPCSGFHDTLDAAGRPAASKAVSSPLQGEAGQWVRAEIAPALYSFDPPLDAVGLERLFEPGERIARLEAAGLATEAHCFQTHQRRRQYQESREQGYPIGSGTVESGIKQFKQRLTGAGMRWSRSRPSVCWLFARRL